MRMEASTTIVSTTTPSSSLQQESNHSRSHTEPFIKTTDHSSPQRRSIDSPRAATKRALERDFPSALPSPTKSENKQFKFTTPSIPPRKTQTRKASGPLKSPKVSSFHSIREDQATTPTSAPIPTLTSPSSYFKAQPSSSGPEPRSPPAKRPPASRSSHGIETSTGPPPALSTQRTLSQDKVWKPSIPDVTTSAPLLSLATPAEPASPLIESPTSINAVVKETQDKASTEPSSPVKSPQKSVSKSKDSRKLGSPIMATETRDYESDTFEEDEEPTMRGLDGFVNEDEGRGPSSENKSRSEDLFLNIAKAEPRELEIGARTERRRSKIALSSLHSSNTRLNGGTFTFQGSSPDQSPYNQDNSPSLHNRPAASAHPLDDSSRLRYFGVKPTRSFVPVPRSILGRSSRETSPETPETFHRIDANIDAVNRNYRSTHLSANRPGSRMVSASEAGYRQDGTESELSTTAPSTVWDELDDLKSRIKKLELTGKLPSSSAAAMSNAAAERPRTATTTVTTMSSSPKHGRKTSTSPVESAFPGVPSHVHPNLHEALAKAKPTLSCDVYQKLEASVSDALALATIMGSAATQSSGASTIGGSGSSERVARRKVDNMCRSLTELAIALGVEQPATQVASQPVARPISRDATSARKSFGGSESVSRYQRRASEEPEGNPRAQTRVASRLETRRSSILGLNYAGGSPRLVSHGSSPSSQTPSLVGTRLNRNPIATRYRTGLDGADDEEHSPRPVSRAITELGVSASRYTPRDRTSISREYTSQHPLPNTKSVERSPSVVGSSGLPVRRTYLSATSNPSTPTIQPGFRRFGAGQRPSSSAGNTPESAETRNARYVSGGNFAVQSRVRTGSLSQRVWTTQEEQTQEGA